MKREDFSFVVSSLPLGSERARVHVLFSDRERPLCGQGEPPEAGWTYLPDGLAPSVWACWLCATRLSRRLLLDPIDGVSPPDLLRKPIFPPVSRVPKRPIRVTKPEPLYSQRRS